jgi:hypothetical protein
VRLGIGVSHKKLSLKRDFHEIRLINCHTLLRRDAEFIAVICTFLDPSG